MEESHECSTRGGTHDRINLTGLVQSPEVFSRKDLIKLARRFTFPL
jgi:hypothetical protein